MGENMAMAQATHSMRKGGHAEGCINMLQMLCGARARLCDGRERWDPNA